MTSIFIFRRDFRLSDNIGFINCIKKSKEVLPIFIFNPKQIEPKENEYFSNNCVQFMIESLEYLNDDLKKYGSHLHYFHGHDIDILDEIKKKLDFENIYYNEDYTPFAIKRDNAIKEWCKGVDKKGKKDKIEKKKKEKDEDDSDKDDSDKDDSGKEATVVPNTDYLLAPMGSFLKKDGTPYEKYTPFKNNSKLMVKSKTVKIPEPEHIPSATIMKNKLITLKDCKYMVTKQKDIRDYYVENPNILSHGGREHGLEKLKEITKKEFGEYSDTRNILMKHTTLLSPYIKFGCISIREVYYKVFELFGVDHTLIDQLYWREFYYYIAYYFPRVLEGKSLKEKYDNIKWRNNKKQFEAWKHGLTGFPVVDAGMRQLNMCGYMHNRARLITSAILIKILNINWKWGEKYFATMLIDYDPVVNNGNWQWGAGCGVDSQPYFRIFNPWTQAKDYDPDCVYIKKWIPELKDVPAKDILKWDLVCGNYKNINYPKPIVDYKEERNVIISTYKDGLE
jgi:deoxyribodipyrimidine photo-lyase